MPRLPVDGKKGVEHRITLGTKEREMVQQFVSSNSFNKIATPTVDLLNDVTGMIAVVAIFSAVTGIVVELSGVNTVEELEKAVKQAYKNWRIQKNAEYVAYRAAQGDPIEPGLLNYDPDDNSFFDDLKFVWGSLKELWGAGGYPGGY